MLPRDLHRATLQHVTVAIDDAEMGTWHVRVDHVQFNLDESHIPPDVIVYCNWIERLWGRKGKAQ
jgi:hypothetical protein